MTRDLKSIWKNQSKENSTMTAEELRMKVEKYHARARREVMDALILGLACIHPIV